VQNAEEIRKIIEIYKMLIENIESSLKQGTAENKYKMTVELELKKVHLAYYETQLRKISS
jgi:hypothetical protein